MNLYLDKADLRPEFQNVSGDQVKFEHFTVKAQRVILAVGSGQFREEQFYDDGYFDICPPESKD